MKKQVPINICGEVIYPGESVSLALRLPELYSCLPAYMPIKVFHGKKSGSTLLVFAALNGNEINGTEIINRLVNLKRIKSLSGTLIAVPVVNVFGLANRSKFLPGHVDLSINFPGSATGTHADRIANLFITELFDKADCAISLETGQLNYSNLPEVSVNLEQDDCKVIAEKFGAPVICQYDKDPGTLAQYAYETKSKFMTYMAGEASRFDNKAIKMGVKGIVNIMRHMEMITEKASLTQQSKPPNFFMEKSFWVRSPVSGISSSQIKLGDYVKKNSLLSTIRDPFGSEENYKLNSSRDGIIVGLNNIPLIKEGEALFKVAAFPESKEAETHLKNWDNPS